MALIQCYVFALIHMIVIHHVTQGKCIGSRSVGKNDSALANDNQPDLDTQKIFYIGTYFKASWHTAAKYCRHRGMLLASINNEKEQQDLEATLNKYGTFVPDFIWISGTNINESRVFAWNNGMTRTPITYTKWHKGQPTIGNEAYCVGLHQKEGGYGWTTYGCSSGYYFICEISDFNAYSNFCLNNHFV